MFIFSGNIAMLLWLGIRSVCPQCLVTNEVTKILAERHCLMTSPRRWRRPASHEPIVSQLYSPRIETTLTTNNRIEIFCLHLVYSLTLWRYGCGANVITFFIIKLNRCTNFSNLFCHETLNFSDSSSVHHQEFIHCTLSNGIRHTGL
jgi:hypothetical protein